MDRTLDPVASQPFRADKPAFPLEAENDDEPNKQGLLSKLLYLQADCIKVIH
jgi:hypothetical protein